MQIGQTNLFSQEPSQLRRIYHILVTVFGFQEFRGLQYNIISHVINGGDALVLMPTGGGKSLCYQMAALAREGMGLVISPLIALMDDQVAAMRQLGIRAGALHSELDKIEEAHIRVQIANGQLDILYMSPERVLSSSTLDYLSTRRLSVIAIDEAHCISVWGHEFRPEYRSLAQLPQIFPLVPRIALTATADPKTRQDISSALGMEKAKWFITSFYRPNLQLVVRQKPADQQQCLSILPHDEASIVYCASRNKTERVTQFLRKLDHLAVTYHAGLSIQEKRAALLRFRSGEPLIMVATTAFGMGIDRPDIRNVIHIDTPDTPESYYQQIGRAGRDGKAAFTTLFYGSDDIVRARYWLEKSQAPDSQKQIMYQRLQSMMAYIETTQCRAQTLLRCFAEELPEPCGICDICRNPIRVFDATVSAQKVMTVIYKTGQIFGAKHVISILRGLNSESISRHRHDKLSVHGIGRDQSESFWRSVIRQLLIRNILILKGNFWSLVLNEKKAESIFDGTKKLFLRQNAYIASPSCVGRQLVRDAQSFSVDDEELFEKLKNWRMTEAREQELPPYAIFHDSVLKEIVLLRPHVKEEFAKIKGINVHKISRYGDVLVDILEEHSRYKGNY